MCDLRRLETDLVRAILGGRRYSQKNSVGLCVLLHNTLTVFMTKIFHFPLLYMTWPKIRYSSYSKRNLRGFLLMVLSIVINTMPYLWSKWPKLILYLSPKRLNNHVLWGFPYPCISYREVPHPRWVSSRIKTDLIAFCVPLWPGKRSTPYGGITS